MYKTANHGVFFFHSLLFFAYNLQFVPRITHCSFHIQNSVARLQFSAEKMNKTISFCLALGRPTVIVTITESFYVPVHVTTIMSHF